MGQFDGKTVMVTGAAGNLARGVLTRFAQEGAQLVLVDVRQEWLDGTVQALAGILGEHLVLVGDIGKPAEMDALIAQAVEKFGQIDVLLHTAGGFAMGTPVHESDFEVYERMMYLNVQLTWVACGRVAKHMIDKGIKGSIISVLARSGLKGAKNMAAYTASKAAAERIIQSMAAELLEHGVRVNGIMPSTIDTPANRRDMPNADFAKWVSPAQIADVMAFLASDAASAISGDSIGVYNRA
jgi:NAD(P)-dependent dehydrogenase (short-subunit alcohol dehydrogenase family)